MKGRAGSLGEGSSSPLLPMFRASVASAPANFLSASWLTNANRGASRSSLSTIDSEGIREKEGGSPEVNGTNSDSNGREEAAKPMTGYRFRKSGRGDPDPNLNPHHRRHHRRHLYGHHQWHSLEALSRILGVASLVCFSAGAGLTIVGFASRGLPASACLLFQIAGPVLLAAALVTFLLGSVLGRVWKGEWQKRQTEMETLVRMKLEKLTKEILSQQHQHRVFSYPQQQQLLLSHLSQLSPESRSILETVPFDVEAGLSKMTKRSRFFSKRGSLVNVSSSTETTTANSRRSSRLATGANTNANGSSLQVDKALEGLKRDLERRLEVLPARKANSLFPSFDLPGIQISRIETLDLDQASGSSCCSAKRFIIVHSDVASSDFSFASEYSLLSTARSKSRSRSSNASLFDFSPRDSEWDADVSLGSRDSQASIVTGRSSISGRDYPVGFQRQYYPFHRASCGQPPHQHLLLLPPGAKDAVNAVDGASMDDCPSSPRRHSSPVSQSHKFAGIFCSGARERFDGGFFPPEFDGSSFASRLNLAARHPYSSCSPLLLKPSSGPSDNGYLAAATTTTSDNNDASGSVITDATASSLSFEAGAVVSRNQALIQQLRSSKPPRRPSYEEQRRVSWLRKRSHGDQSVISMKIAEDSNDEEGGGGEEAQARRDAGEEGEGEGSIQRDSFEASTSMAEDGGKPSDAGSLPSDSRGPEANGAEAARGKSEAAARDGQRDDPSPDDKRKRKKGTEATSEEEAQVDPRWRLFFGGSASMAMAATAAVSSVVDRKRACLKRNTTDDSEVERRVAKLLREIEFSATDSVEDCSKTTTTATTRGGGVGGDGFQPLRGAMPVLNVFPYDSKSSDGTTSLSLSLRARRDSFAARGRQQQQQQTTSSSSSSQPFSFFASRQLSLHQPCRGVEVQTQTEDVAVDEGRDKSPEGSGERGGGRGEGRGGGEDSPRRRRSERRGGPKLAQNPSTDTSSGVSLQNAATGSGGQTQHPQTSIASGTSRLKLFAKALPQVIAAATSAAAMECNRLVSARSRSSSRKRRRKHKPADADGKN